jgi:hypothetical protein
MMFQTIKPKKSRAICQFWATASKIGWYGVPSQSVPGILLVVLSTRRVLFSRIYDNRFTERINTLRCSTACDIKTTVSEIERPGLD